MVNNDFWLTSGWHLLDKDETGFLIPTEDFMKAYYYRPEVAPVEESCEAELALHKKLIEAPFAIIEKNELNDIKDKDVTITHTLTSIFCPMADEITKNIKEAVERVKGVEIVTVTLTHTPPFTKEMMSEEARLTLNI